MVDLTAAAGSNRAGRTRAPTKDGSAALKRKWRAAPNSPRSARAKLEEALGKLGITDEEATPLMIDDADEGKPKKWLLAGKVLHRHLLHIQTIANALRPA